MARLPGESNPHTNFQIMQVLVYEVICGTMLLTGRPGKAVLAYLASEVPVELPMCEHTDDVDRALLATAASLVHKDPLHRGTATRLMHILRTLLQRQKLFSL